MLRVPVRELRAKLGPFLDLVERGEAIVITRRGRAVAKLVPETGEPGEEPRYPLRGSLLRMSEDFDEPLEEPWEAFGDGPRQEGEP